MGIMRSLALPALMLVIPISALLTTGERVSAQEKSPPPEHRHKPVEIPGNPLYTLMDVELKRPRRLLFDAAGDLIIVDSEAGSVLRMDKEGEVTTVAENLAEPSGAALDKDGNLFVSNHADGNEGEGTVVRITPDGEQEIIADNLTGPKGLVLDAKGILYIACFDEGKIVRLGEKGREDFVQEIPSPAGVVFDAKGNLYAVNSIPGTLSKITPQGEVTELARDLTIPSDICLGPDGELIVCNYGGEQLTAVDAAGNASRYLRVPQGTIGVAFDPDGNALLVNWDLAVLLKVTTRLAIECPHCKEKIPLRIKPPAEENQEEEEEEEEEEGI